MKNNKYTIKKYLEDDVFEKDLCKFNNRIRIKSQADYLNHIAIIAFPNLAVAVEYCEESIYPNVKESKTQNNFFIALDSSLFLINVKMHEVILYCEAGDLIYEVFEVNDLIVVIEEIGISVFKRDGQRVWNYSSDLVSNYELDGEILTLTTYSGVFELDVVNFKEKIIQLR